MTDLNFCTDANDPRIESGVVLEELRQLKSEETAAVTERIRREATLESSVKTLLAEYEAAMDDFSGRPPVSASEGELTGLGRYLLSISEGVKGVDDRTRALRESLEKESEGKERAVARSEKWKQRVGRAESRLAWLEETMEGGPWWRGRLWRRLRREWERREP